MPPILDLRLGLSLQAGRRQPPAGTPSLSLDFTDTSQPTLDLDFTTQRYAVFAAEQTGDFAGTYKIWS